MLVWASIWIALRVSTDADAERNWIAGGAFGSADSGDAAEIISRGRRRFVESSSILLASSCSSMIWVTVGFWAATFAILAFSQRPAPMRPSSMRAQMRHSATAPLAVRQRMMLRRRAWAIASMSPLSRTSSATATADGILERRPPASMTSSLSLLPGSASGGEFTSTTFTASPDALMSAALTTERSSSVASGAKGV